MLIIPIKEGENIDRALKRFKRKFDKTGGMRELRSRKQFLKPSIKNAGLDPDNLPNADKSAMNFGSGGNTDSKAWKDIWGSGQGIGGIKDSPSVAELVGRIKSEYENAFNDFKSKVEN